MRNHSCANDFDLHENETARRTRFHMKGFALRLVLKQRHKRTRKWPILRVSLFEAFVVMSRRKKTSETEVTNVLINLITVIQTATRGTWKTAVTRW